MEVFIKQNSNQKKYSWTTYLYVVSMFLFILILVSTHLPEEHQQEVFSRDFDQISTSDTLRIITRNHPLTFYLHRGTRRGFDYELIQRFAMEKGLVLEVKLANNWQDLIPMLNHGEGDIIAAVMTVTDNRSEQVAFTSEYLQVEQVAVGTVEAPPPYEMDQLNGATFTLRRGTSYDERLLELIDEGYSIDIEYIDESLHQSDPIEMVAKGEKSLTAVDNTIANLESHFFPGLEVGVSLSEPQGVAWAVRKNSPLLLEELNKFLSRNERSAFFNILRKRYFENTERFLKHRSVQLAYRDHGSLSRYDHYFKEAGERYEQDWLKIAAQAYHESNFYPDRVSWAGAVGVMQLMPRTAEEMGVSNIFDPRDNIFGGARYMRKLLNLYGSLEEEERWKIALAAYNCGMGHIADARIIARNDGRNPGKWDAIRISLIQLEKPEVYSKAKYGRCRGSETIKYVDDITARYEMFRNLIPADSILEQQEMMTFASLTR